MAKLIINIKEGILEVETEDNAFIEKVYTDFKTTVAEQITKKINAETDTPDNNPRVTTLPDIKIKDNSPKKVSKVSKTNETYQQNADLVLWKTDDKPDLKQFYAKKNPTSGYECNAVFVYYLQKIVKVEKITPQDIYTCYKYVGKRYASALRQNLIDTKRDKGWIDTSNIQAIALTPKGENYVEYELPIHKEASQK